MLRAPLRLASGAFPRFLHAWGLQRELGHVPHCKSVRAAFVMLQVFEKLGLSLFDYMRKNGYKPFPMDLVQVGLRKRAGRGQGCPKGVWVWFR